MITGEETEVLVERLLSEGVPSGVVARVFALEESLIREAQHSVRIKHYGTDDLAEYTEQLQWDALAHAREVLATGSAVDKARILNTVFGKQIALNARRTPESTRKAQESLIDVLRKQREGDIQPRSEDDNPFVVHAVVGEDEE
jgi:hypothetical protein